LEEQQGGRGSLWRAAVIALLLAVGVNLLVPYTQHRMATVSLLDGMLPLGIFLPFLVLLFLINPLLRLISPGSALESWELVFIFIVGFVCASIGEMTGSLVAVISSPYYFATPENQWAEYVHRNLKPWLLVRDRSALGTFYEGAQPGAVVNWGAWVAPLFWWLSLLAAVMVACLALGVILRKQWVERERLSFPLADIPLELAREPEAGRCFPDFFHRPLFWLGFAIPFFIVSWNCIGYFGALFPEIRVGGSAFRFTPEFPLYIPRLNFLVLGFAYFVHLEVLFSIWFFNLVLLGEQALTNRLGILPHHMTEFAVVPSVTVQMFGALIFFVLASLWLARRHLKEVVSKALGRRAEIDDSQEMFSYRLAVVALVLAVVYMVAWLVRAGMSWQMSVIFLFFSFVIYLALARILAMSGLIFLSAPWSVQDMVNAFMPQAWMDRASTAVKNLMRATHQNSKGWILPSSTHGARLAYTLGPRARSVGKVLLVTFLVAMAASCVSTCFLGYRYGAYNFGTWEFGRANKFPFDHTVTQIKMLATPRSLNWLGLGFAGFGAAFTAFLSLMLYRFPWWPLHPVGFAVGMAWEVRTAGFSILIAWACKATVLAVGGSSLYRRSRSFFLGMIVGYASGLLVSLGVDLVFFPGEGHAIFGG